MGKRPDPRTESTKMRIKKALLEYLCDSPFERITVKNICDSAGIDRSTFYTHYRNLSATLDEIMTRLWKKSLQGSRTTAH